MIEQEETRHREAADRGESSDLRGDGIEMQIIEKERRERKQQPEHVQPDGHANGFGGCPLQAELKEGGGETDRGDDNDGERTSEGGASGVEHDQSECTQQQAGGDDRPATGWVGRMVGQSRVISNRVAGACIVVAGACRGRALDKQEAQAAADGAKTEGTCVTRSMR